MPIEIRELHIKAVVSPSQASTESQDGKGSGLTPKKMEQLIDMCVEKVLAILKEQQER